MQRMHRDCLCKMEIAGRHDVDTIYAERGDDGPHFDLARPGQEANQAIQDAVNKIKEGGVKN